MKIYLLIIGLIFNSFLYSEIISISENSERLRKKYASFKNIISKDSSSYMHANNFPINLIGISHQEQYIYSLIGDEIYRNIENLKVNHDIFINGHLKEIFTFKKEDTIVDKQNIDYLTDKVIISSHDDKNNIKSSFTCTKNNYKVDIYRHIFLLDKIYEQELACRDQSQEMIQKIQFTYIGNLLDHKEAFPAIEIHTKIIINCSSTKELCTNQFIFSEALLIFKPNRNELHKVVSLSNNSTSTTQGVSFSITEY